MAHTQPQQQPDAAADAAADAEADSNKQATLERDIRRLRLLESQAYDLRTAIPQMLAPLNNLRHLLSAPSSHSPFSSSSSSPSPPLSPTFDTDVASESSGAIDPKKAELIFSAFQATVAKTMADLESFKQLWNDRQTAAVMNRAVQSRAADEHDIMVCVFGDNVGREKVGSLGMEGDGDPRFELDTQQVRDGGADVTMTG